MRRLVRRLAQAMLVVLAGVDLWLGQPGRFWGESLVQVGLLVALVLVAGYLHFDYLRSQNPVGFAGSAGGPPGSTPNASDISG